MAPPHANLARKSVQTGVKKSATSALTDLPSQDDGPKQLTESVGWISLEESTEQTLCFWTQELRHPQLGSEIHAIQCLQQKPAPVSSQYRVASGTRDGTSSRCTHPTKNRTPAIPESEKEPL